MYVGIYRCENCGFGTDDTGKGRRQGGIICEKDKKNFVFYFDYGVAIQQKSDASICNGNKLSASC